MAKKSAKPGPKHDWPTIRAAYNVEVAETGTVNAERLAQKFDVPYGTLRNKISQDGWRAEADKLRAEVVEKTAQAAVPMIVKHRVEVMDRHLTFLGQVRQAALNQVGLAAKAGTLTVNQAMKVIFDSLRAEKMLQGMVEEGATGKMSEDEIRAAMFEDFVKRMSAEVPGAELVSSEGGGQKAH